METHLNAEQQTDEELIAEAAREGSDGPAFVALMSRHRGRVWSICYRLMGNEHDAQDAAQEVFVRLFFQRAKFEGRSKFSTWLHGIAVRTCLGMRRSRGRRARHEVLASEARLENQAAGSPATASASLDLEMMLSTLGEEDRAMLLLKYSEEYTFEELADIFDMTTSACKMRVSRARARLEERFGEPKNEPAQ